MSRMGHRFGYLAGYVSAMRLTISPLSILTLPPRSRIFMTLLAAAPMPDLYMSSWKLCSPSLRGNRRYSSLQNGSSLAQIWMILAGGFIGTLASMSRVSWNSLMISYAVVLDRTPVIRYNSGPEISPPPSSSRIFRHFVKYDRCISANRSGSLA